MNNKPSSILRNDCR